MPVNELSELVQGNREWTVHVYVSRLWQHRGAIDDGPIKHTDIVFQDAQGNHMYAEIAGTLVKDFIPRIKEGRIYEIKRFLVSPRKNWYMPMEGDSMIRFGKYITVREINANLMDYPLCTYDLTPIDDLPSPTDNPQTFTDVIGVITGVSATAQYHSASRSAPSIKRVVYLSDLSGYEISVVLWGERATTFDGEDVLQSAKDGPVIAIFVGTLVKPFEGRRGLSGGAPCRWYINEDLPEINELRNQLQGKVPAVRGVLLPGQTDAEISAQVDLEIKTIKELINLNIWDHKKTKFYCDVVISRLSPGERWWFHACTSCNKGTIPYGAAYKCSSKTCGGTGGSPRYRICYIGSDGVDDVELVFFDKADKELIGKPVLTILRSKVPNGMSVEDAIQFARTEQSTPRELASIVSRKYRLVVSVTTKSFEPESSSPSYQVHRIQADHGKRARSSESSALGRRPGLALASPSSSACSSGLSPAGETLASQLILVEENSLTGLSDGSGSVGIVASTVGSGNTLTQTPPSVAKPPKTSDSKDGGDTSVKKSLFSKTSSGSDIVVLPELDSQVQREEPVVLMTDDLETMAEPPVDASTEKSSTKRRQKTKQEPASKKNKL